MRTKTEIKKKYWKLAQRAKKIQSQNEKPNIPGLVQLSEIQGNLSALNWVLKNIKEL